MGWFNNLVEKLNPAQPQIVQDYGEDHYSTINATTVANAYYTVEVVNRGVNLVVDSCADITYDINNKNNKSGIYKPGKEKLTKTRLNKLINIRPNPYQDIHSFKRSIFLDLLVEGNAFIYFDGMSLFLLPAAQVEVVSDKVTFIKEYIYNSTTKFAPNEVIHIKENSVSSIFRGDSRLKAALSSISVILAMMSFHQTYFDNNAIPGLVLKTPNNLSRKVKDRILKEWSQHYNPRLGGKRPAILDGDFSLESLGHTDRRELDFEASFTLHEDKILKAIGVPPLLLSSGNNANISPNLKLFYTATILPLVERLSSSLEYFFGYDLKPVKSDIIALKPELKDEANYYSTLANAGIITVNEVRSKLRLPKAKEEHADELRIPANIAGSALDSNQGGKPKDDNDE